jgi:cell wall-associated NlpC family hydrolase
MERLIAPLTDAQRDAFIAAAHTLVGVPFRAQGRPPRGIDCIGVIVWSLREAGVDVPNDRIDYGKLPARRKLAAELEAALGAPVMRGRVTADKLQPGDVLTMQWGVEEGHVALVVSHPEGLGIIHAYANKQKVIYTRLDELILSNVYGVYRP